MKSVLLTVIMTHNCTQKLAIKLSFVLVHSSFAVGLSCVKVESWDDQLCEYESPHKKSLYLVLFNDTWSQEALGHLVSCTTMLFSMLANHQIKHRATH